MIDIIIGLILVVVIGYGIVVTKKHFKKKSGCCGSNDYQAKPRKLKNIQYNKIMDVEGMCCQSCANRMIEVFNDLGYASLQTDIKNRKAYLSLEKEMSDDEIIKLVEKCGFKVNSIE